MTIKMRKKKQTNTNLIQVENEEKEVYGMCAIYKKPATR